MRIFLTGATGFLGGHIVRALAARGHEVTCLAREPAAGALEAQALAGVRVVRGRFTDPAAWLDAVAGCEAVVNAVGIIREAAGASFQAVHADAPQALFDAAARAGARKIVQISAMGVEGPLAERTAYQRTKAEADGYLRGLGVPYVVLRPSFVYGPGDLSMRLFAALAALPVTPVAGDGRYLVQPVYVDDLVRAVVAAVEDDAASGLTVDVGGGSTLTFDAMLDVLARWLGKRRARKLHVPWPVMAIAARATDALGGRGPITTDELRMLRRGAHGDNTLLRERLGVDPVPFEAGMARRPDADAARQAARLTPIRVPLRLSVAFIWIATGIISALVYPIEGSLALLAEVGVTGALAAPLVYATSAAEVALGAALALGVRPVLLGGLSLLLVLGFTAILSAGMPELWVHPFGPLTKNVPLIGATLAMMALER